MRRLATLALAVAVLLPGGALADAERAKEAFWKGDFAAAATDYAAALEASPDDPDLWYNRGTAEARAGNHGAAVHALEQTLLFDPDHGDAAYNLSVVRQQIVDGALSGRSEQRTILPGEDDVGTGLLTALAPRALGITFAGAWVLLFLLLHIIRRRPRPGVRTAASFAAVVMGLVALATGGLLLGRQSVVEGRIYGVVADDVTARQGPGEQYQAVAAVLPGVKVRLSGEEGDWRQVILPDGGGAWMPDDAVKALRRP